MPKKTPSEIQRDINDALTLRELEETAADYVGVARARALAKDGYFKRQLAASRTSSPPRRATRPEPEYEVRDIGGAVLARAETLEGAMKAADEKLAPDYVVKVYRLFQQAPVAERVRWDPKTKRRPWDVF